MFRFFISVLYTAVLLLRLSLTDLKTKELENIHIVCILLSFFGFSVKFKSRILGLIIPLLLTPFYGFGDIMIFMSLGFSLGYKNILYIIILSALLGGLFGLYLLLFKKEKRNDSFAFAPIILVSYLINAFRIAQAF